MSARARDPSAALAQARRDLANFPTEIFADWLDEYVLRSGWPPKAPHETVPTDSWANLLVHKPVAYWQQVRWERQMITYDSYMFTESSRNIVSDLITLHVFGISNQMTHVSGGRETFDFHTRLMRTEKRFVSPPMLLKQGQRYELMDGCHRVSALLGILIRNPTDQAIPRAHNTWIASGPDIP